MSPDSIEPTPAADPRANYDYIGDQRTYSGIVDDLVPRVDGEVRFDTYSRQLYATDASAYEVTPIGVVYPRSTDDVAAVVSYCAKQEIPILPRGGGTSLAGQAVNEAVVLDFSRHMDEIHNIDPESAVARVDPGVVLATLNAELESHGLKFAPDPAAGDRSVIGGAIGNNSTGSHSLKYEKTDAYIEECEVVLADGTVTTFGEVTLKELHKHADPDGDVESRIYAEVARILEEERETIETRYPDLKRNVSGYNFARLVDEADSRSVNLGRLLAGSEGTLAVVTGATVSLEPIPETKSLALLAYEDILDAMEDVTPILECHDPAAIELVDDVLIDLAADTEEFADVVAMLPDNARSVLLVEFYAEDDDHGTKQVSDLLDDRLPTETAGTGQYAFDAMVAHDTERLSRFWKLRKAGMPILMGRTSDAKHISFLEDCAIPPANLPEYVDEFQDILEEYDTFASFYAHAGPGVLHVRPLLDTKMPDELESMEALADDVTDLVVKYGGSISGEHGDGRARTQWNRKLYGTELWETFKDLKSAFDPDWILNPGQVCGFDPDDTSPSRPPERANATSMTENLRFDPDYEFDAGFEPELAWENENGFQGMTELCHGCGGCRSQQGTTGGVMCPTYRAAEEEVTSTRGRANMLRQAMSGKLPEDEVFSDEFRREVLDLCIGCKGCARDCPSEVDMAKLKAEVTHEYHQREGASLRDHLFANLAQLSKIASVLAPVSNWITTIPGARTLLEKTIGISSDRTLPTFQRDTLRNWFDQRGPRVSEREAERKVVLFPDLYTNFNHPEAGKAAIRVLEAAGVHVRIADNTDSGRPAYSKGFIEKAREIARENVNALAPAVEEGWDIVVVEPSDAVMFQSDYLDHLPGDRTETVANATYGICEYLAVFDLDDTLDTDAPATTHTYHGHCHQKAVKKDHYAVSVLRRVGYEVDPLDSGCCGMAGSFGYEAEHQSMSDAIGSILFEQINKSDGDQIVAPGASCRTQIGDRNGINSKPSTPIEMVARALNR
jgi:FAD/FMN-containing dehydrogenase/Fe-S oxidoreductase